MARKKKPDMAEKIADWAIFNGTMPMLNKELARRIRRAIREARAEAVKAERERCQRHAVALSREYLTAYQAQPARESLNLEVSRDIEDLAGKIKKGIP